MKLAQELAAGVAEMGMEVTPEQQKKLLDYLALLHKWNGVYNLTAIRKQEQMVSNHLLDSLGSVAAPVAATLAGCRVRRRFAGHCVGSDASGMVVYFAGQQQQKDRLRAAGGH